jgi:hypothetical protein
MGPSRCLRNGSANGRAQQSEKIWLMKLDLGAENVLFRTPMNMEKWRFRILMQRFGVNNAKRQTEKL